ncbi:heterodisulfide reductase-related iron-sulfur binding cluster [Streptomyces canus]|uniref:heterodisulfide reductase-related iron-sulfur binding cluster n=1 Tax=Streptomyces canus TaxID=58343 RepID=UPI00386F2E20
MHVALFITCFNDMMFPGTGRAATGLLERLGHTVEFPQGQTCCGQMHFNTGCRPETLPMVFRGGFRGLRRRGPPFRLQRGTRHHPPGPAVARYRRPPRRHGRAAHGGGPIHPTYRPSHIQCPSGLILRFECTTSRDHGISVDPLDRPCTEVP